MRKPVWIVMAAVLAFSISGCTEKQETETGSDAGIQMAFDNSFAAQDFTDGLLEELLEQKGIEDYGIELTSGGFITDDPITYIVGYRYHHDGITETYGYKLKQTEAGFTVLEEGAEVGEFIVGNGG